jgi:hypothetical protein
MRSKIRGDLEQKLAAETASLEERLRTEEELLRRIAVLEKKSDTLAGQAGPLGELETSLKKLSEQFAAFQQSYVCDIDKLVALLLEVQSALPSRKRAGLSDRMRSFMVKQRKDEEEDVVEPMIPGLKRTA